jgi:hypothetical protein
MNPITDSYQFCLNQQEWNISPPFVLHNEQSFWQFLINPYHSWTWTAEGIF